MSRFDLTEALLALAITLMCAPGVIWRIMMLWEAIR